MDYTALFCQVDDFCQEFEPLWQKKLIDSGERRRRRNKRIDRHRVFDQFAARGKSSMGWFFGFKLHLVVNGCGELLAARLAESREAMNTKQMIEKMATQGLWTSPGGKTPSATLYSSIIREIATKGNAPRFVKADRGQFVVNAQAAGK